MAVLVVVALLLSKRSSHEDLIPPTLTAPLESELRADSQGSLLYADELAPEPRGTRGTPDPGGASSSLDRLLELHQSHPSNPDVAAWLISGYLATNQLRNADPFLRESLARYPDDPRFLNLAAILAYKRNSLDEAEADLRKAAARERNATVLVNLAVVRRQEGDEREAQALLKEVLTRFPDSPIQPYVRELAAQAH
jgi:tetratricopeptide (TPR) repeat protein